LRNEKNDAEKVDKPSVQKPSIQKGRNRFANFDESTDIDFDELERKERELRKKRLENRKE